MPKSRQSVKLFTPSPEQQALLRDTMYGSESPGPVLHDFQTLIDFIGDQGIEASGKYDVLPIKLLSALNAHLKFNVAVDLERGQFRSYPNLQVLFLLARATGLVIVTTIARTRTLVIDPVVRASWQSLTPVEQYFSLLDAWMSEAKAETIGERAGVLGDLFHAAQDTWEHISEKGQHFSVAERGSQSNLFAYDVMRYSTAFLALFGLVEVIQGAPIKGRLWVPASIRQTKFGQAVFQVLQRKLGRSFDLSFLGNLGFPEVAGIEEAGNDVPASDDAVSFDSIQPLFKEYVPAWEKSLSVSLPEFRDGLYVFRVSIGRTARTIAIPATATLNDLAMAILQAMDFSRDHLWDFSLPDRFGAPMRIGHPYAPDGINPTTDEVTIGSLPLSIGQTIEFRYDYGDNWRFNVRLERIAALGREKRPKLVHSVGKAPRQYEWDEDEDY